MDKGIATETIVKLMICLVVMGIVIFLIYKYVLGSGLSERECAARMTAWCVQCQIANWAGGTRMGKDLGECALKYWGFGREDQLCNNFENNCKAFIPST